MLPFERFLQPSKNPFFLFGPRGTGKTFWTKQAFPDALRIDLLAPNEFRNYAGYPERLRERIVKARELYEGGKFRVIVDEIQRVPELLDVIHGLIVDFQEIQFILTGSSARKLRKTGVNLLGGRASLREMHPFMAAELGDAFDFQRALQIGLLPVIWQSETPKDALSSYVGTYLEEEVQNEGLVRNVGKFARFLEVASFSHGSVPNMASISRECGIDAKTVGSYFTILEDLLISFSVPVFSSRAKRALVTKSKFYFCDLGIFQNLRPRQLTDDTSSIGGFALEGLIAQHLRAWCAYSEGKHRLYYWQTKSGVEVDFIVCGENELWAFEVKSSRTIKNEHLQNLKIFSEDYPEAKLCLLYCGTEATFRNRISCIPCDQFLRNLRPNQLRF